MTPGSSVTTPALPSLTRKRIDNRLTRKGGVLTFPSFQSDFAIPNNPHARTRVSAVAVGIQQAFALLGSLAIWPLTNRHGRRPAMLLCSAVFCVGVVLETLRSGSIATFYAGRVVCGLGVGGSATIIPIYLGEMSPADMRARLGSCYQFTFTVGILVSYWVDYAVVRIHPTAEVKSGTEDSGSGESWRWQIPVALQIVPGAFMGLGALTLHESVRWLLFNADANPANERKAWHSLTWIRGADTTTTNSSSLKPIQSEFTSIKQSIQTEHHARADFHLSELITHKPNLHRLLLGFTIFLAQQSTGATALAYFGPQFFGMLVGSNPHDGSPSPSPSAGNDTTLLLTGIFGAVKVLACLVFVVFVAERFGRRFLLITGALVMAGCMIVTGVVVKMYPPPAPTPPPSSSSQTGETEKETAIPIPPAALTTILLIYLNIVAFNLSWGPLPWPCIAEIFPTRMREPGVASGVAAQWLFNFAWSAATPYLMSAWGSATFVLFGVLDLGIAAFVGRFFVETRGLPLEEVEGLFERRPGHGHGHGDGDGDVGDERDCEDGERTRLQPADCSPRTSSDER